MPISLDTINAFYGTRLKPYEVESFLRKEAESAGIREPRNLEEKAVSLIGRPLYEALIKGYTRKQWNRDPRELPAAIITRLPVRADYNTCYFSDPYQGVPVEGYGRLIARLLAHERITVRTGVDFDGELRRLAAARPDLTVIYTGMIDRYFDWCYGELEWRSLRFEFETVNVRDYQGVSVMNYADADVPYTRIHEFKHYHPERTEAFACAKSVICREYPLDHAAGREPYYPVNSAANQALYARYRQRADSLRKVIFCGRLGTYAYCDMDVAVKQALDIFARDIAPGGRLWTTK
ncbi:MAG: UDP-galactopyranose mutase, partial [Deltaproteobacteria bacterium]|jgi:UDP-galactopyranose mutase|nr:UDP-galactopyranose mutase [Deltaproteobacteria bacterium]